LCAVTREFEKEKMKSATKPRATEDEEFVIEPIAFRPSGISAKGRRRRFRPLPMILLAGLLVLAATAGFIFTAKSVRLVFKPVPDRIAIEGTWPSIALGGRYLLLPGNYTVRAAKQGYRRFQKLLEITAAQNQEYEFSLQKLPGLLTVTSEPVGARVLLDGQARGITPLTGIEVSPGRHELVFTTDRYLKHRTEVLIKGGGFKQNLSVKLTPRWAPVTIGSNPAGAEVRIDGEHAGTTPLTTDVLDGTHRLEIGLAGFETWQGKFTVVANEPRILPKVTLDKADGHVSMRSQPAGANVIVNGEYRGQTPLELALASGQTHELTVVKSGYESASRTVQIGADEDKALNLQLKARLGKVRIVSQPKGAMLYVDGELEGEANQRLMLVAVPHELEIKKDGYAPYRTTITPRPGFAQEVRVQLKTLEQVKAEATPWTITTGAGQQLRLVQPGKFTMGASRSEQGRRANETLRPVELTRAFYIGKYEVTNREFREFQPNHSSGIIQRTTLDLDDQPVARVTWNQAARYCNWLSKKEGLPLAYEIQGGKVVAVRPMTTGYRLPTEAEWEWAARFADGANATKYPWGDAMPPKAGNYADSSASRLVPSYLDNYNDGYPGAAPVGSYKPNALGLFDLGGNVAEWTHDYYTIYLATYKKVAMDPTGPSHGRFHVIRGSSWAQSSITELRLTYRDYDDKARPDVGFRIARYVQ
jgi:formylglycine-generating enzyme required for sulfatase activity